MVFLALGRFCPCPKTVWHSPHWGNVAGAPVLPMWAWEGTASSPSGLPWCLTWERTLLQCRRPRLSLWVSRTPWRGEMDPGDPWIQDPGSVQVMGLQRVRYNWATHTSTLSLTRDVYSEPSPVHLPPRHSGCPLRLHTLLERQSQSRSASEQDQTPVPVTANSELKSPQAQGWESGTRLRRHGLWQVPMGGETSAENRDTRFQTLYVDWEQERRTW